MKIRNKKIKIIAIITILVITIIYGIWKENKGKIKIENIIKYFLFFYFYFSSGFSISGVNVSILTTFPPSLVLIKVTPCVDLPRTLISFT